MLKPNLKNYLTYLSLLFVVCLVLIIAFQNFDNPTMHHQASISSNNSSSKTAIQSATLHDHSTLMAYYSHQPYVVRDELNDQTDVTLNFAYIYPLSENFQWTIKRGVKTVIDSEKSQAPFFSPYQFAQKGAYDIFANTYDANSLLFTQASKRLIIGEECDIHRIIDLQLTDGSLTTGQSATFELEDSDEFDNITWTTSLNAKEIKGEQLTIDRLPNNSSHIYIGVSAEEKAHPQCLTYRQKIFKINTNLYPHLNTFRPFDKDDSKTTLTLENNWMYKYRNPAYGNDPQQFLIDIKHADTCSLKINTNDAETIDCETKQALFLQPKTANLDICQEDIITLTAKRDDNKKSIYKKYYRFCPARPNASCLALCYFAPLNQRPYQHTCLFESLYKRECTGICYGNLCQFGGNIPGGGMGGGGGSGITATCTQALRERNLCQSGDSGTGVRSLCPIVGWQGTCSPIPRDPDPGPGTAPTPTPTGDPGPGTAPPTTSGSDPGPGTEPPRDTRPGLCPTSGTTCYRCEQGSVIPSTRRESNGRCTWRCGSPGQGSRSGECSGQMTPEDGECHNPTIRCDLCKKGNNTNKGEKGEHNAICTWDCTPRFGGTKPVSCEYTRPPADGVCNTGGNYCKVGTRIEYNNDPDNDPTTYKRTWKCTGLYGGDPSETCEYTPDINPECGSFSLQSKGRCTKGRRIDYEFDESTYTHTWACQSIYDSNLKITCPPYKEPNEDGICRNEVKRGCTKGTFVSGSYKAHETKEHTWVWQCKGTGGGETDDCEFILSRNGKCITGSGCDRCWNSGVYSTEQATDKNDTATECTWICPGQGNGQNSETCRYEKKIFDGECPQTPTVCYQCAKGTKTNDRVEDEMCKWICKGGRDGGNDSEECSMKQPDSTAPPTTQPPRGCATTTTCRDGSAATRESITDSNGNIVGYRHRCHGQVCGTTGVD